MLSVARLVCPPDVVLTPSPPSPSPLASGGCPVLPAAAGEYTLPLLMALPGAAVLSTASVLTGV